VWRTWHRPLESGPVEEAEKLEVQVLEARKRRLGEEHSFYGQSRFHL
jgi:hypothetical protein